MVMKRKVNGSNHGGVKFFPHACRSREILPTLVDLCFLCKSELDSESYTMVFFIFEYDAPTKSENSTEEKSQLCISFPAFLKKCIDKSKPMMAIMV